MSDSLPSKAAEQDDRVARRARNRRNSTAEALPPPSSMEGMALSTFVPLLIVLTVFVLSVHTVMDPDCWFHMAFGRYLLENRSLPQGDVFSQTAMGREWISSGWASSVILHLLYQRAGAGGLVAGVFLVGIAVHLSLYFMALNVFGNRGSAALIVFPAIWMSYLRLTPRPELASQLFLAFVLMLLVADRVSADSKSPPMPRRLWLLPVLFALWANGHAGFLIGFMPLGLYGLAHAVGWWEHRDRGRLLRLAACALCGLTWMLNPYGPRLVALAGKIKSIPDVEKFIFEWMPLFKAGFPLPTAAYWGVALLLGMGLLAFVFSKPKPPLWQTIAIALFVALVFRERRHLAIAAVGISALLLPHLRGLDRLFARRWFVAPVIALGFTAILTTLQVNGTLQTGRGKPRASVEDMLLPASATAFLQKNPPPSPMFNAYGPGGYLLYHLGPAVKVFIDGRLDIYDEKTWLDFVALQEGTLSLEDAQKKYGFNTLVLYNRDYGANPNAVPPQALQSMKWAMVYFDDSYTVFVRIAPEHDAYLREHGFTTVNPFGLDGLMMAIRDPNALPIVRAEIDRARRISNDSAFTLQIAALVAEQTGNTAEAEQLRAQARAKNPHLNIRTK